MSNSGDIFVNTLARKLVGVGRRDRLTMTGTSGATGTDEETQVRYLPEFTEIGDILQLIDSDGDLVASWEDPTDVGGGAGGLRYRQFVIELDGGGGFDFVLDTDGSPIMSLEVVEL